MTTNPTWALRLGARPPLEWTTRHREILEMSESLWDDLRDRWIQALREQDELEGETGDEELLRARKDVQRAWENLRESRNDTGLQQALQEARETLRRERKRIRPQIAEELKALWRARDEQCRSMAVGKGRRYPKLHHGVYNDVYRRFQTAAREAAKIGRIVRPSVQHASRSIYYQCMAHSVGGERIEIPGKKRRKVVGGTLVGLTWGQLRSRTGAPRLEDYTTRSPRVTRKLGLLTMPMGPRLLVSIPVRLHREPPDDALVKGIRIVEERGKWHVVISIQAPAITPIPRVRETRSMACDLSAHPEPDGSVRVLRLVDDEGQQIDLSLPPVMVEPFRYASHLEAALDAEARAVAEDMGVRGLLRSRAYEALYDLARQQGRREWVYGTALTGEARHEQLLVAREQAAGSPEKYATLAARVLGDRIGREWVRGTRQRAMRRREDLYRRAARWIAERASVLLVVPPSRMIPTKGIDAHVLRRIAGLYVLGVSQRRHADRWPLQGGALPWAMQRAGGQIVRVEKRFEPKVSQSKIVRLEEELEQHLRRGGTPLRRRHYETGVPLANERDS